MGGGPEEGSAPPPPNGRTRAMGSLKKVVYSRCDNGLSGRARRERKARIRGGEREYKSATAKKFSRRALVAQRKERYPRPLDSSALLAAEPGRARHRAYKRPTHLTFRVANRTTPSRLR